MFRFTLPRGLSLCFCVLLTAGSAACDNGATTAPIPVFEASIYDTGSFLVTDAGVDSGVTPDAAKDAARDVSHDARPDTTLSDAHAEASSHADGASHDVGTDVAHEASRDAAESDAKLDGTHDGGSKTDAHDAGVVDAARDGKG
jgi:hypothetical protein